MSCSPHDSDLEHLRKGGSTALGEVFSGYRASLERIIQYRLDPRIRGRIDPADVLQESFLEINRRLADYLENPAVSPMIWMRQITLQILIDVHRRHFREKRTPLAEMRARETNSADDSASRVDPVLIAANTSPSRFVARAEEALIVQSALAQLNEIDREVITLRHFELLSNQQVAEVLGISKTAASNRYVRAVAKFGQILREANPSTDHPGAAHGR